MVRMVVCYPKLELHGGSGGIRGFDEHQILKVNKITSRSNPIAWIRHFDF